MPSTWHACHKLRKELACRLCIFFTHMGTQGCQGQGCLLCWQNNARDCIQSKLKSTVCCTQQMSRENRVRVLQDVSGLHVPDLSRLTLQPTSLKNILQWINAEYNDKQFTMIIILTLNKVQFTRNELRQLITFYNVVSFVHRKVTQCMFHGQIFVCCLKRTHSHWKQRPRLMSNVSTVCRAANWSFHKGSLQLLKGTTFSVVQKGPTAINQPKYPTVFEKTSNLPKFSFSSPFLVAQS